MLNVKLHHLSFTTDNLQKMMAFYRDQMGMTDIKKSGGDIILQAKDRIMHLANGLKNQLNYAGYGAPSQAELMSLRQRHKEAGLVILPSPSLVFGTEAYTLIDPDGNKMVFGLGAELTNTTNAMPGRMQHVVVGSLNVQPMIDYYTEKVGFVVSDVVRRDDGTITACFMRSDNEHHSFAVFLGDSVKLDHNCYETENWNDIRDWADHFAKSEIALWWGPGRHGPGDNLFFMVSDPDGNSVELSAELEIVADARKTGDRVHDERTRNYGAQGKLRGE
jgi:catechol 2,3-dioxygenase-like lactoylglutathione lyase family enzyme